MRLIRNQKGYTLAEALTAICVTGIIVTGVMAMMLGSSRAYDGVTTQAYTDTAAVIAMQQMVNDVREAKAVSIQDSGATLEITFPVKTSDGYYDRFTSDSANPVDYYLADSTGIKGHAGTNLWRSLGSNKAIVRKAVKLLTFEQDTARSIKITVRTENTSVDGPVDTDLTQRVVYLRNY